MFSKKNSLRNHLALFATAVPFALTMTFSTAQAQDYCGEQRNLALINGDIQLMDKDQTVASSALIVNGFVASIDGDDYADQVCTDVIDLKGMTTIPGLIDNHTHFIRIQNRPGYETRVLETSFSVAEAVQGLAEHAGNIPTGELVTAIGGIRRGQFAEDRFPTLEELDASIPDNPIYISEFGFGPGQTNTKGRDLLRSLGVTVGDDGSVAEQDDTAQAYDALAKNMTDDHRRRQLIDLTTWANSVGLTGMLDMSGFTPPGPLLQVGGLDKAAGYNPILSLDRDKELTIRTRLYIPTSTDTDENLTVLRARLDNIFPNFGSDMLKYIGVGEGLVRPQRGHASPLGDYGAKAMHLLAERGFPYHQHLHTPEHIGAYLDVAEKINEEITLAELRWTPGHLSGITKEQIERIADLGLGMGLHGQPYLTPVGPNQGGTPWRTALESGAVALAGGSDGARIAPLNPWTIIYYMITGKNYAGALVNEGETIGVYDAVRLYASADQGWFTNEDDTFGGIGVGRYADIVVLSKNVFDPDVVPVEDIRQMTAALTIVGGKIVYSDGTLSDSTH